MIACKFQLDTTGTYLLIYSQDRKAVHTQTGDPGFISAICEAVGLTGPLGKVYAMAKQEESGEIIIGERLNKQNW